MEPTDFRVIPLCFCFEIFDNHQYDRQHSFVFSSFNFSFTTYTEQATPAEKQKTTRRGGEQEKKKKKHFFVCVCVCVIKKSSFFLLCVSIWIVATFLHLSQKTHKK